MLLGLGEYLIAMSKPGRGVVAGSLDIKMHYSVWTKDSSQVY